MKAFIQENVSGLLIALVIAGIAYCLGRLVPVVGGPVFGITLGIMIASLWKIPARAGKGVKSSKANFNFTRIFPWFILGL